MQQTGRAGRDGKPLSAVLMYNSRMERSNLENMERRAKASFEVMLRAVDTNVGICLRRVISRHFDSKDIACTYIQTLAKCVMCAKRCMLTTT